MFLLAGGIYTLITIYTRSKADFLETFRGIKWGSAYEWVTCDFNNFIYLQGIDIDIPKPSKVFNSMCIARSSTNLI